MAERFDEYYEKKEAQLLRDIRDSIAIPSVAGEADGKGNPFGKPVTKCLEHILDRGTAFGFQTNNVDHYVGEITMGSGEHLIGILCHADVVDAGDGWTTEPFTACVKEGKLYGRGAIDDKGPMMCCLYAMDYIQSNHLLPENTRIRMIIGTDEEENWISIKKYLEREPEIPEISIVPDANFPIISCEKGLVNLTMTVPVFLAEQNDGAGKLLYIESLYGGERPNVVASGAGCRITCADQDYDEKQLIERIREIGDELGVAVTAETEEGVIFVQVKGKAAHAMTPEKGVNAISYLMELLYRVTLDGQYGFAQQNIVEFYHQYFGLSYDGAGMHLDWHDEASGPLTVNIGLLEMKNSRLTIAINLRYPVTRTFDEVKDALNVVCKDASASIEFGVCMEPVYFDKDSRIVKALMDVYQSSTGDMVSQPISLGGATYARAIPNAIAFGPVFPDQEELAHEADEYYCVADYKRITEIYANALLKLSAIVE